jgi:DNA-binding GntR family transcriptional regulator
MENEPKAIHAFPLLKHRAYEDIKQRIVDPTLRPDEQLIEPRLAEQVGFSRSPIREAVQRLEQEGLVYSLPFKGRFVAEINNKAIRDIFQLREALERRERVRAESGVSAHRRSVLEDFLHSNDFKFFFRR